jgi:hypothetical protein
MVHCGQKGVIFPSVEEWRWVLGSPLTMVEKNMSGKEMSKEVLLYKPGASGTLALSLIKQIGKHDSHLLAHDIQA